MDLGSDVNFSGIGRSGLEDLRGDTIIKVIGVGGAGGSVVRRMIESGIDTVDYAVVNTDKMVLDSNPAPIKSSNPDLPIPEKLTSEPKSILSDKNLEYSYTLDFLKKNCNYFITEKLKIRLKTSL